MKTKISVMSLILGLGFSVDAAVVTSYDALQPSGFVSASYTPATNDLTGYSIKNTTSRRDMGQSFRAFTDDVIKSFSYRLEANITSDASLAPFTVKVYESVSTATVGTLISTQTGNYLNASLNPVSSGWVTFDITDVPTTEGKYYTCVLSWDNTSSAMQQVFSVNSQNGYSAGKLWQTTNGVDYDGTGFDMAFSIEGTIEPEAENIIVSHTTTVPNSRILACFTNNLTGLSWRNNDTSQRDMGQSFLVDSDAKMDSISFQLTGNIQGGASESAFTIKLFESASEGAIGTIISTQKGKYLPNNLNPVAPGWVTFDIENVDLFSGKYYTCMLSWDLSGVSGQEQVLGVNAGGGYSNGRTWISSDGTSYTDPGYDLAFCVQYIPSLESRIVSLKTFSNNVLEMVVETQSPSTAFPKMINDLQFGEWTNALHSIDGNDPFIETNLTYSISTSSNYVIFVKGDEASQFFKVDVSNP